MTTVATGIKAEAVAATFLERHGCQVVTRNWRTRWCEIDIVAKRGEVLYFCEVKYRLHNRQGSGIEYITPKKLRQMDFAASFWVHAHTWLGVYHLSAIEVSGPNFQVTQAIRELT